MSEERIGPTYATCSECGGDNGDGYEPITHYENCSHAPQGKARKAQGVRVELTPEMRAVFGLPPENPVTPMTSPHSSSAPMSEEQLARLEEWSRHGNGGRALADAVAEIHRLRSAADPEQMKRLIAEAIEEHEAECCPEDMGCKEYIAYLGSLVHSPAAASPPAAGRREEIREAIRWYVNRDAESRHWEQAHDAEERTLNRIESLFAAAPRSAETETPKTKVFSRPECVFHYCPTPEGCLQRCASDRNSPAQEMHRG